jgi:ring-1,2-phenylacetyl-CoA epoxidase subunit PaaE
MIIKKYTGKITDSIDLSTSAKEIHISLSEPIDFIPGSFMNVFIDVNGEKIRRAFSISSSSDKHDSITVTVRLNPSGAVTPLFWNKNMIGESVELMGPLGLNTVDKMKQNKIYLFGFGVGVGVVKSIADYFSKQQNIENLTIVTGSKFENEILYKDYLDKLSQDSKNISVLHVVSRPDTESNIPKGHIQDHIDKFDFNNSDVYVCGQDKACNDLVEKIKLKQINNCNFFIEGFH